MNLLSEVVGWLFVVLSFASVIVGVYLGSTVDGWYYLITAAGVIVITIELAVGGDGPTWKDRA